MSLTLCFEDVRGVKREQGAKGGPSSSQHSQANGKLQCLYIDGAYKVSTISISYLLIVSVLFAFVNFSNIHLSIVFSVVC